MTTSDTYTIGYIDEHGDIVVVATISNRVLNVPAETFKCIVEMTVEQIHWLAGRNVAAFPRQDAPDTVEV